MLKKTKWYPSKTYKPVRVGLYEVKTTRLVVTGTGAKFYHNKVASLPSTFNPRFRFWNGVSWQLVNYAFLPMVTSYAFGRVTNLYWRGLTEESYHSLLGT